MSLDLDGLLDGTLRSRAKPKSDAQLVTHAAPYQRRAACGSSVLPLAQVPSSGLLTVPSLTASASSHGRTAIGKLSAWATSQVPGWAAARRPRWNPRLNRENTSRQQARALPAANVDHAAGLFSARRRPDVSSSVRLVKDWLGDCSMRMSYQSSWSTENASVKTCHVNSVWCFAGSVPPASSPPPTIIGTSQKGGRHADTADRGSTGQAATKKGPLDALAKGASAPAPVEATCVVAVPLPRAQPTASGPAAPAHASADAAPPVRPSTSTGGGGLPLLPAPAPAEPCPTDGLALWALRRFMQQHAGEVAGKTTGEVCFKLVKPTTAERKCAFVDLLRGQTRDSDGSGPVAVAHATVFISHAWACPIEELVAAVEMHFAPTTAAGADAGAAVEPYVWFDILTVRRRVTCLPQAPACLAGALLRPFSRSLSLVSAAAVLSAALHCYI